jgi:hypothetical protein
MPRIVLTAAAVRGIQRCRQFLEAKSPIAVRRAAEVIDRHLKLLATSPEIGRPYDLQPELRELLIDFGDSGYVAMYRHEKHSDSVFVLAFRHQKECGY